MSARKLRTTQPATKRPVRRWLCAKVFNLAGAGSAEHDAGNTVLSWIVAFATGTSADTLHKVYMRRRSAPGEDSGVVECWFKSVRITSAVMR
jgi:hypothetical protein